MIVKLNDGSSVDVQRMTVAETTMVINDIDAQIRKAEQKFCSLHDLQVKQIADIKSRTDAQRERLRGRLVDMQQLKNDLIALVTEKRRLVKEENIKNANNEDRRLLSVIKKMIPNDEFMRFVAIAEQEKVSS